MNEYNDLQKELLSLPKGSIVTKKINGKERHYLQWHENGKTLSSYIKEENYFEIRKKVERRKEVEKRIQSLSTPQSKKRLSFKMKVYLGKELKNFCSVTDEMKERDCFPSLMKFLLAENTRKLLILYGLRRTGKTTLCLQAIRKLNYQGCAYLHCTSKDNIKVLSDTLTSLYENGYQFIFIDEITLLSDFISGSPILADIHALSGMKIVLSGTDSLSFYIAKGEELYDRVYTLHTTYIPFKEYAKLLNIHDVDTYIEYGGTLCKENLFFDDDFVEGDVTFYDSIHARRYIDSAIVNNIQHSLRCDEYSSRYSLSKELMEKKELTNIINRYLENMNHRFLLSVLEKEFISHDLGSAKQLLFKEGIPGISAALYEINTHDVVERFKVLASIKNIGDLGIQPDQEILSELKEFLKELDIIAMLPGERGEEYYYFTQPGMRYCLTKALMYSLMEDEYFSKLTDDDIEYIIRKMDEDVKGRMLEDIVLYSTFKARKDVQIKKVSRMADEIDMMVKERDGIHLYEIKHSDQRDSHQTKHLRNQEFLNYLEYKYGKILSRNVLYEGEDKEVNGIHYRNVNEYLENLK